MITLRTGDRAAAFEVPFRVYSAGSPYVSPMRGDLDRILDPARNPLVTEGHGRFELFTAHRDGKPVGRIVASIHDASNMRHGTRRAQFGFFDCGDEPEVARTLLEAAEGWGRERGADEIAGNFNLTAMQMAGVVTGGFDAAPYTDMMWSPPHIARLLDSNGYRPVFDMTTFAYDLEQLDPSVLLGPKQRAILDDPEYEWLGVTRRTFAARMEDARRVLNAGFDRNPMFVPLTPAEFEFQAGEMMWIMDFRLPVIVHHRGEPVGALLCVPDMNPFIRDTRSRLGIATPIHFLRHRLSRSRAVILLYSVDPAHQNRGLNGAMLFRLATALKASGYASVGGTWIADVNGASLRQAEKIGARSLHELAIFGKRLDG
ncbi:GNAT family N-acetyltransferase [Sphingomonas sp. G-3-2-10]|uniref:GNAT family N-acetyltransferase n=1 Tax=Sphingomonas sp. G-3-2-10 TaxID=2728838 RepID=UPI00146F03E9|nr:GNAT family N-acetyltransferase [Sphingomonas sp. G-3-2-10]NML07404.1 GNAT family N-acetyltransferase [Sphingomonas sp. G-3-2-10]